MSSDENSEIPPAGWSSLQKYLAHGGGVMLLQAYIERRKADKATAEKRCSELANIMNPAPGGAIPQNAWAELLWLTILKELDHVIADLQAFCESNTDGDQQLRVLREALRIDKGHAPSDAKRTDIQWEIERRWVDAYLCMQNDGVFRTENAIAKEISKVINVSTKTITNVWNAKKQSEPWQAEWAKHIIAYAKLQSQIVSSTTQKKRTIYQHKRKKITFGKIEN